MKRDRQRAGTIGPRLMSLLAMALVVAVGCVPFSRIDQPDTYRPDVPRVAVLGDSITTSAGANILAANSAQTDWWTHVMAEPGWDIAGLIAGDDDVMAQPAMAPDAVIINIGTNDTGQCYNDEGCSAQSWTALALSGLWSDYSSVPCRIGVTTVFEPGITVINDRLSDLADEGTINHLADWKAHSADHPEWFTDSVGHQTYEGRVAYADFLVDALESCPG
ncbi:MAG: GDSL-type esterase/lipase family protein [Acidimicrobiales bacterium]